jgi:hypothetical protein
LPLEGRYVLVDGGIEPLVVVLREGIEVGARAGLGGEAGRHAHPRSVRRQSIGLVYPDRLGPGREGQIREHPCVAGAAAVVPGEPFDERQASFLIALQQRTAALGGAELARVVAVHLVRVVGRIVEFADGLGVDVGQVIVLVEDFQERLPVARDLELAPAGADHVAQRPGRVQTGEVAEPIGKRLDVVVEADERETLAGIRAQRDQSVLLEREILRLVHAGRHQEAAVQGVGPAVEGAANRPAVAVAFEQLGTAVAAGIGECAQRALVVPEHDDGRPADVQGRVVTGSRPAIYPPDTHPGAPEERLLLPAEERRIGVASGRQRARAARGQSGRGQPLAQPRPIDVSRTPTGHRWSPRQHPYPGPSLADFRALGKGRRALIGRAKRVGYTAPTIAMRGNCEAN